MSAIKKAFKAIGQGIEKAVHSVGQIAKGIATLDLKAAAKGFKGLADAGLTMARGAINLMPAAMAANTLLHGALDKVLNQVQKTAQKVADSVVDSVEGGLSNIKDGVVATAKGIAKGNLSKALKGLGQMALGAVETASNFGPGGVAKNMARMAVDAAIGLAGQEVAKGVSKVLDPHGTSRFGALASNLVGAAVGGGLGGSRAGHFASMGEAPAGILRGAGTAVRETAQDAAVDFAAGQVPALATKVHAALSPDGGSGPAPGITQALGAPAAPPALRGAVDQFVNQSMARTVLDALPASLGKLNLPEMRGLAALSQAPDAVADAVQGLGNDARTSARHIKQQMNQDIETAIARATAQAAESMTQRLQEGLQGLQDSLGNMQLSIANVASVASNSALAPIQQASRSVFDAVEAAIGSAARKSAEQGLADQLMPQDGDAMAAPAPALAQAALDTRIGPYQIRA